MRRKGRATRILVRNAASRQHRGGCMHAGNCMPACCHVMFEFGERELVLSTEMCSGNNLLKPSVMLLHMSSYATLKIIRSVSL